MLVAPQLNNFLLKNDMAVSLEQALSRVIVKIFFRPHSSNEFSSALAINSLLCEEIGTNASTFLWSFHSLSIKYTVMHI